MVAYHVGKLFPFHDIFIDPEIHNVRNVSCLLKTNRSDLSFARQMTISTQHKLGPGIRQGFSCRLSFRVNFYRKKLKFRWKCSTIIIFRVPCSQWSVYCVVYMWQKDNKYNHERIQHRCFQTSRGCTRKTGWIGFRIIRRYVILRKRNCILFYKSYLFYPDKSLHD